MASFDKDYERDMAAQYGDTVKGTFAPNDGMDDVKKDAPTDGGTPTPSPIDGMLQQVRKDFDETFDKVHSSFGTMFGEFESFHGVSIQAFSAYGQVQMIEHAEVERLDQVEPEIDGFTAQFGDFGQDDAGGQAMAGASIH